MLLKDRLVTALHSVTKHNSAIDHTLSNFSHHCNDLAARFAMQGMQLHELMYKLNSSWQICMK